MKNDAHEYWWSQYMQVKSSILVNKILFVPGKGAAINVYPWVTTQILLPNKNFNYLNNHYTENMKFYAELLDEIDVYREWKGSFLHDLRAFNSQ